LRFAGTAARPSANPNGILRGKIARFEKSPAFQGWVKMRRIEKSRRDGRKYLLSLTGLVNLGGREPTAKAVGYFQSCASVVRA
jgi:hypothetical protein